MGVDRELRSGKRQKVGLTCLDVPPINSQSPDQASLGEGPVHLDSSKGRMPDHKTHENHSNDNAEKEGQKQGSKIYGKVSKKFRGQTSGNQSNETNGVLGIMAVSPVEKETCIKNENISDKLFPEHNGKVFNSLLLLKGTNVTMPEPGLSPASKAKKIQASVSSLKDGCKVVAHCLDPGTCNEKFCNVYVNNNIERKIYRKLKLFLYKRGLPLGPGWKVRVTGNYPKQYSYFISPDNIKFKSMVTVARHLEDKKDFTNAMEDSESREPKRGIANASVFFNANASQAETTPQNLAMDQVANENYEQDLYSQRIPKGQGFIGQQEDTASTVVEHGLNQVCNSTVRAFDEIETWPSSGLSGLGLEDANNIDKNTLHELRRINGQEDMKEKQQGHWTEVLEQMLKSSSMTTGGVRSCICKALSSGPPGCAKKMLEHTILKDASKRSGAVPMKEALLSVLAWYHGEQIGHGQAQREMFSKRPESVQKIARTQKGVFMNGSERKKAPEQVIASSDLVTERCRNVFLNIISSEKFAALCNLVHGNFAGSRMHEVFDFRLIDLRMNAGTYGKSPELFALDMQKLWKNVHEIGREMVVLADTLSQQSRDCYQKEVASLLEEEAADSFDTTEKATVHGHFIYQEDLDGASQETINKHHNNEHKSKFVQITRDEECNNCVVTSLRNMQTNPHGGRAGRERGIEDLNDNPKTFSTCPGDETQIVIKDVEDATNKCLLCEQCDLPSSGTDGGACRICGVDMNNNCILICDGCEAAYHMYCLSPALEEVPSGSWYCPSCYAAGKESSEVGLFNDRKENMPAEENTEIVVYHCVVCERLSKRETIRPNRQAEFESDGKEDTLNCPRKEVDPDGNGGEFDFQSDRAETEVHVGGQELEFYTDEPEIGEVCIVCSKGERDDDHLIKCSNVKCTSKFFHLNCLKPPLDTVSPRSWYCPSCLCRVCLVDENDECIILCDGCDDGYHTYCLKPPLNSIPSGKWYCPSCLKKYKRKKGKGPCFATNKPFGHVRPKKSKEINPLASGIVRGSKDPSDRGEDHVMEKSVPRARSKKIVQSVTTSSMSAQRVTPVISGRSLSAVTKLAKGIKPKTIGRRKKL